MLKRNGLAFVLCCGLSLAMYEVGAEEAGEPKPPPKPPSKTAKSSGSKMLLPDLPPPKLSAEELEKLVAPVALYPDALLSQVLPAATSPADVVKAGRYLEKNKGAKKPPQGADQSWDPAVVTLMKFPEVIKMMYQDIEWTKKLGKAVFNQEQEVYDAIQQVRTRAQASGLLKTNEKQVVSEDQEVIVVESANPEVVYVPSYNPEVIWVDDYDGTFYTWGVGYPVGYGWCYALNWHRRCIAYHSHWYHPGHHRYHHYHYKQHRAYARGYARGRASWRPHDPATPLRRPAVHAHSAYRKTGAHGKYASVRRTGVKPGTRTTSRTGTKPGSRPGSRYSTHAKKKAGTFGGYKRGSSTRKYASRGAKSRSRSTYRKPTHSTYKPRTPSRPQMGAREYYQRTAFSGHRSGDRARSYSSRGRSSRGYSAARSRGGSRGGARRGGGRR